MDVFDLDPRQDVMTALRLSDTDGDGDTTGDGCGESPPQGPTTGCLLPA
ncbi:MAG: hypothetical protein HOY79_18890 [Streptomyces sp.]|nr:hypothetical protein [Streptomyces sp.]